MTLSEKLRSLRKQTGMSQEKLAETLGVSRQAITKWETGAGTPDISNLVAISDLFHISVDELLTDTKRERKQEDYLFESVTEYDVDESKKFDITLGGAASVTMAGYDGEKLKVRLASNTLKDIQQNFKVKLDDIPKAMDVSLNRLNGVTEAQTKEALSVFLLLPRKYAGPIELAVNCGSLEITDIETKSIEFDGKAPRVTLKNLITTVEINCNLDMELTVEDVTGSVELNQLYATSRITVPEDYPFQTVRKGIGTSITYERGGKAAEDFSTADGKNLIELNGLKSELVICTVGKEEE